MTIYVNYDTVHDMYFPMYNNILYCMADIYKFLYLYAENLIAIVCPKCTYSYDGILFLCPQLNKLVGLSPQCSTLLRT